LAEAQPLAHHLKPAGRAAGRHVGAGGARRRLNEKDGRNAHQRHDIGSCVIWRGAEAYCMWC
jgi:hypothetical protein